MQDYIKRFIFIKILLLSLISYSQNLKNFVFNYKGIEIVVFEHRSNISLPYIGASKNTFTPNYMEFFSQVEKLVRHVAPKKGDILQLFLITKSNSKNQIFINHLSKKLRLSPNDYRHHLISLCMGDCDKIDKLHKVYIYSVEDGEVLKFQ